MSEYIIEWGGIGALLKELISEYGSLPIIVKRLRKERLREPIVRCRDCRWYREEWNRKLMRDTIYCDWLDGAHVEPDGFCKWGKRRSA